MRVTGNWLQGRGKKILVCETVARGRILSLRYGREMVLDL